MDFSGFFTDLFSELNNNHSWLVILFLLGAFLIGLITAWLYWRRKWKNIYNELTIHKKKYTTLNAQYETQTSTLELKEADLKRARLEIDELRARIRQLEEEKGHLHGDLQAARLDFDRVSTEKTELISREKGYLTKLEDFDAMVLGLKTKNQNLAERADQDSNALNELAQLRAKYEALEKENGELKINVKDGIALGASYDASKQQVADLEGELNALKLQLSSLETERDSLQQEKIALGSIQSSNDDLQARLDALIKENADMRDRLQDSIALNESYSDYEALKLQLGNLQIEKDALEQEKIALGSLQSNNDDLEARLDALVKENADMRDRLQDSIALNESYSDYDALKLQLGNLQVERDALEQEKIALGAAQSSSNDLQAELDTLQKENAELKSRLQDSVALNEVYSDYDVLKIKVSSLKDENDELKRQLEEREASALESFSAAKDGGTGADPEKAKASVKAALGTKIALATADDKDDLKLINGVGPFIEKKLNGLGIYTFEQVSQFDDELSNQVTEAIEFFPGRIQRDNWVGQAKELMLKKQSGTLGDAAIPLSSKYNLDDLKVVEGIGPKIEGLLNDGGIHTWAELSNTPTSRLQEILDGGGDRYKMHNPSTWAQQAGLAANGEWEELQKLQDELDGGVRNTAIFKTDAAVMDIDHPLTKKYKLDDLKLVEGIGPKIEGLLNDGGIHTWAALAHTPVSRLQEILDAAGDRYRIHNPATWAQQAELAATGKWEELDKLQDELNGGRVV